MSETNKQTAVFTTLLVLIVALIVASCSTVNRSPQTVEESLYVTASYGEALVHSVNDAFSSGAINMVQHGEAIAALQDAKDAVQAGLDAYKIGQYDTAQNTLDKAEALLRSVALLLSRYEEDT